MHKILLIIIPLFLFGLDLPKQKIVVNAQTYSDTTAKMYLYDNMKLIKTIDVVLGRNGFGYLKKEGDGQTPHGEYTLTKAFGYHDMHLHIDYLKVDSKHKCVDDSNSRHYNQIIKEDKNGRDYYSYEDMLRDDNLYEYGVVIDYNSEQKKGAGSCIFIHVQRDDRSPTAGCIAMAKEDMVFILNWLDKQKQPVIVMGVDVLDTH